MKLKGMTEIAPNLVKGKNLQIESNWPTTYSKLTEAKARINPKQKLKTKTKS